MARPSPPAAAVIVETLPTSMAATAPDVSGLLTCLSCHDGNYAKGAMMKNRSMRRCPPPTAPRTPSRPCSATTARVAGQYLNDHPVGLNASMACGGQYNWDCTDQHHRHGRDDRHQLGKLRDRTTASLSASGIYNNSAVVTVHDLPQPALDERG